MKMTLEELKDAQESLAAASEGKEIQWKDGSGEWRSMAEGNYDGLFDALMHGEHVRPKPAPKTRRWNCPADVPLNCWLRCDDKIRLVIGITEEGVVMWHWNYGNNPIVHPWHSLGCLEYSTDRVTWKPLEVME